MGHHAVQPQHLGALRGLVQPLMTKVYEEVVDGHGDDLREGAVDDGPAVVFDAAYVVLLLHGGDGTLHSPLVQGAGDAELVEFDADAILFDDVQGMLGKSA